MPDCKTVEFLRSVHAIDGDLALVARSALGLVERMHASEINPVAVMYLRELVEHIYVETGRPLLAHLQAGTDCDVCAALLAGNA